MDRALDNYGELLRPTLTAVGLPYEKMGEKAIFLANSSEEEAEALVPMSLFIGG